MHDIILITGKVKYNITLDPTIWIFDDRRFELAERIPEADGLAVELNTFLKHAEPSSEATYIICHRSKGEDVELTMQQAMTAYLCFAIGGKPIGEGGPALLYLADGTNKERPMDYIQELEVV